ncbi:ABC transporter ATP-binding protein [Magnetospirillum sp. UT-4]|uniref:ABC transporter ATP-binding protein n=1 Tax=Magnetospirillum sp. UT-4 TaxID=2681467 RepID=UPI00137EAF6B|nr:ABC transporter ATP-binding protein [Magnetospirillum sp. UT-4]CAA7621752.1 putative ABC-type phospholipid-lipopolysaccharide transport system ATPase component [Magnetospirillum sp. UT-4]
MISLIRTIFSFVDRGNRSRLALLLAMMIATALFEMANLGLVLVLMKLVSAPELAAQWLPFLAGMEQRTLLILAALAFAVFFLGKTLAVWLLIRTTNRWSAVMMAEFQSGVFRHQLRRPYLHCLTSSSTMTLQNTVMSSYRAFESVRVILNILIELLLMGATGLVLVLVEPWVVAGGAVVVGILAFAFHRIVGPIFQRFGSQLLRSEHRLIGVTTQAFHSSRSIKLHHCESHFEQVFRAAAETDTEYRARSFTFQHIPRLMLEAALILGFVIAIIALLLTRGTLEGMLPTLGVFALASIRLLPSFNRVLQYLGELRQRESSVRQVDRDLAALAGEPEENDGSDVAPLVFRTGLDLDGVGFRYPGAEVQALSDVNLKVGHGESVGLVGASGAGKSTLVEIILGLLPPTSGRMLVDGVDIAGRTRSWQACLGYVPQHVYLLDDTLRRNVGFGLADEAISEERVWAALERAHLAEVARSLPNGLDTILGENAMRLSGGQRQRLGIARALYREPPVIVLDEATSALDNETEFLVAQALDELAGEKTLFIVAHRLSTVRCCDRLVFLDRGRIAAVGSYGQLMETCPDFRQLVRHGEFATAVAE